MITLNITPVAKPRMTQSDRWSNRSCVVQYWQYKDAAREAIGNQPFPHPAHIIFVLPMPNSWSEKKKCLFDRQPHCQRPDWDNLAKGLTDALFDEDCELWDVRVTKLWGRQGKIVIAPMASVTPQSVAS
jgi:Holliday junction resolvase RusA-like endonuclease